MKGKPPLSAEKPDYACSIIPAATRMSSAMNNIVPIVPDFTSSLTAGKAEFSLSVSFPGPVVTRIKRQPQSEVIGRGGVSCHPVFSEINAHFFGRTDCHAGSRLPAQAAGEAFFYGAVGA
jgi:hypothetical protein